MAAAVGKHGIAQAVFAVQPAKQQPKPTTAKNTRVFQ